jgi:hypothetical protein
MLIILSLTYILMQVIIFPVGIRRIRKRNQECVNYQVEPKSMTNKYRV